VSPPLITFALIAYNQENFIREAIEGAFAQTYLPLEIILSDDCSPDRTFEIMQQKAREYRGGHRLVLNRNPRNLGIGGHVNAVTRLATGQLIVAAAGDDISMPTRTEEIAHQYKLSGGTAKSLFSNAVVINEAGERLHLWYTSPPAQEQQTLEWMSLNTWSVLTGCTHAWSREVFDLMGPISEQIISEDRIVPFRSALLGKLCYIDKPLVHYRKHGGNASQDYGGQENWIFKHMHSERFLKNDIGICETMLKDLATYSQLDRNSRRDLNWHRMAVERNLARAKTCLALFTAGPISRLVLSFRHMALSKDRKAALKLCLVYLAPRAYCRWHRIASSFRKTAKREGR